MGLVSPQCAQCGEKFAIDESTRNGHARKYCDEECAKIACNARHVVYERRIHGRVTKWDGEHCVRCKKKFKGRKRKFCTEEHARLGVIR